MDNQRSFPNGMPIGLMMTMSDMEVLRQRIDSDLVAFGEFQASDIIQHSICQSDFTNIEPGTSQSYQDSTQKPKSMRPIVKN